MSGVSGPCPLLQDTPLLFLKVIWIFFVVKIGFAVNNCMDNMMHFLELVKLKFFLLFADSKIEIVHCTFN